MSNGGKQQEHEETTKNLKKIVEKKNNTKIEEKHKYGPRTLPKPKRWMHQRLT